MEVVASARTPGFRLRLRDVELLRIHNICIHTPPQTCEIISESFSLRTSIPQHPESNHLYEGPAIDLIAAASRPPLPHGHGCADADRGFHQKLVHQTPRPGHSEPQAPGARVTVLHRERNIGDPGTLVACDHLNP